MHRRGYRVHVYLDVFVNSLFFSDHAEQQATRVNGRALSDDRHVRCTADRLFGAYCVLLEVLDPSPRLRWKPCTHLRQSEGELCGCM